MVSFWHFVILPVTRSMARPVCVLSVKVVECGSPVPVSQPGHFMPSAATLERFFKWTALSSFEAGKWAAKPVGSGSDKKLDRGAAFAASRGETQRVQSRLSPDCQFSGGMTGTITHLAIGKDDVQAIDLESLLKVVSSLVVCSLLVIANRVIVRVRMAEVGVSAAFFLVDGALPTASAVRYARQRNPQQYLSASVLALPRRHDRHGRAGDLRSKLFHPRQRVHGGCRRQFSLPPR
jgi:hypothetical protein